MLAFVFLLGISHFKYRLNIARTTPSQTQPVTSSECKRGARDCHEYVCTLTRAELGLAEDSMLNLWVTPWYSSLPMSVSAFFLFLFYKTQSYEIKPIWKCMQNAYISSSKKSKQPKINVLATNTAGVHVIVRLLYFPFISFAVVFFDRIK